VREMRVKMVNRTKEYCPCKKTKVQRHLCKSEIYYQNSIMVWPNPSINRILSFEHIRYKS